MKKTQLTQEGFERFQKELDELKNAKRPVAVERLQRARAMGDLSENSEYVAAKEDLAFTEGRILELEEILKNVEVISDNSNGAVVALGRKVTVEVQSNKETFHIVGEFEADPLNKKVSPTSPVGKALIGKQVGDTVEIEIPAGKKVYKIVDIS